MPKSQVYTRTGDQGETSLANGDRVSKTSERVNIYGHIDELNSYLGLIVSFLKKETTNKDIENDLETIQMELFSLGSNLACPKLDRNKNKIPKLSDNLIKMLELKIDEMDEQLPKLANFILPGGTIVGAHIHVGRTICRKIERLMIDFFKKEEDEELHSQALIFINRLSDYLFVLARYVNFKSGSIEKSWH